MLYIYLYGNMDPINIPPMLAYVPAPWIPWVIRHSRFQKFYDSTIFGLKQGRRSRPSAWANLSRSGANIGLKKRRRRMKEMRKHMFKQCCNWTAKHINNLAHVQNNKKTLDFYQAAQKSQKISGRVQCIFSLCHSLLQETHITLTGLKKPYLAPNKPYIGRLGGI